VNSWLKDMRISSAFILFRFLSFFLLYEYSVEVKTNLIPHEGARESIDRIRSSRLNLPIRHFSLLSSCRCPTAVLALALALIDSYHHDRNQDTLGMNWTQDQFSDRLELESKDHIQDKKKRR
jgi:hypothetical protein